MINLQVGDNDLIGNKFNGHDLHLYLQNKGIKSFQLVWNKESNDKTTFVIAGKKDDREKIKTATINNQNSFSLNGINNFLFYDVLYDELFLNADIIHLHLIHNWLIDLNLLPIMSRLKPMVWTLHDPWALGGHCVHHYDCQKWQQQCSDCPYLKTHYPLNKDNSSLNFALKKNAIQNSKFEIIVASKWMENKVKKSPIFKGKIIHKIPFGINQNIFKPINKSEAKKHFGLNRDTIVLTFRYDESEFKGLDFIDYLLKNLATSKSICLFILGHKKNAEYKYKISHKSFEWVKDDELLAKIYSASDLFLMPSKMETFGMMAIEAMSCGTLPIVLDGTALPEIVAAPKVGVASQRTKEAFAKTVNFYIDHDEARTKRAKLCLVHAQKSYNYQNYVSKIIEVYQETIKKHYLSEEDRVLLNQLKKHMMETADKSNKVYIRQHLPFWKKIFFIVFYKIDKIFPKKLRSYMKYQLLRNNLLKNIVEIF